MNFATKTFQALRIEVNDEMGTISKGIEGAIDILVPGGRLVVISFQGLEDKTVKEIFKQKAKEGIIKFVTKDTIKPKWSEVTKNPRARSAKMKIVEKL
ncbi:MAG TPA: 16S rRNA (cytosine(1402)-N(4))-methyltransferase [Candidatus Yanofskybacteria bacterium]|nr:16S rRNA (cytosine(1402)-N(4))-methyltransferase [Candidatus Yanofskybacteria bacterium]